MRRGSDKRSTGSTSEHTGLGRIRLGRRLSGGGCRHDPGGLLLLPSDAFIGLRDRIPRYRDQVVHLNELDQVRHDESLVMLIGGDADATRVGQEHGFHRLAAGTMQRNEGIDPKDINDFPGEFVSDLLRERNDFVILEA